MRFSSQDVASFADWSFDRNPLHVDPVFARQTHFGQPIVHGILSVLGTLASSASPGGPVRTMELEFRGAVVPGGDYAVHAEPTDEGIVVGLRTAQQPVLTVRAEFGQPVAAPAPEAFSWAIDASAFPSVRQEPAAHSIDELHRGLVVAGIYPEMVMPSQWWMTPSGLTPSQVRVLALASYVTGMELPGLRSLFMRVTVQFHGDAAPGDALQYRARTLRCDKQFRVLDTELLVADAGGRPVATATMRGYVPFSPVTTDLRVLGTQVRASERRLRGRTALVLGASRGLGADIAAALALAGARVYASARHDDATARALCAQVGELGGQLELLVGDAGDSSWCDATRLALEAHHPRLDILVLNACAPPTPIQIGRDGARQQNAYIRENLALIETPLATFLDWVDRSEGSLVYVSSSFVADAPRGFGHYVALKQAGESLTRTAARESSGAAAVIARPPVLQTRWNDTPAGAAGAVPSARIAAHLVNHLAEPRQAGQVDQLHDFPVLDAPIEAAEEIEDTSRDAAFTLRVAASFTIDPLLPGLRFWLKELDVDGAVDVAPYGQVLQTLLDPNSLFASKKKGFNVVLLRLRDWLRELADDQAASIDFVRTYLRETASEVERAFKAHSGRAGSDTLLVICPSLGGASSAENILLRQTESELAAALTGVPGLAVVSAEDFHPLYDVNPDETGDPLRDEIAHIPYRDPYFYVLATIVARHVFRRLVPPRKVVVVDCDNTLWRGVVGEVGAEGIEFDSGHRALHEMLVRLSSSGILVCLCSKNEESDVWRVFETRDDFVLRREHIVAAAINWQPKSQNIRALANRLSLGIDSFVFLDDNPVECAEVRAGCPEVLTLQWPQDAARAETLVRHVWEFDARPATKEDERRTQMYREEVERQDLRQNTLTFDDFIKNLQLTVDAAPLDDDDVRRSAQLTLRTNQFNFTTIRRDESDLHSLRAAGQHEIQTIRVKDRFGDYGLVGLVIAERGSDVWNLDTFLLSCRVLGRGVEHQILAGIGEMAAASGAHAVRMRVDFTKRNTPARSFLESVVEPGMRSADAGGFEAEVPAGVLASLRFQPTGAAEAEVGADAETASPDQAVDVSRMRHREEQVSRTAFELGSMRGLQAALDGRGTVKPGGVPAVDVADVVYGAFARALRVPASTVKEVDRLEALGCDSLKIVEITVALSEQFPWLPSTLLFEHRSVSLILREIDRLVTGSAAAVDTSTSLSTVRAAGPAVSTEMAVVGMHVRCAGVDSPEDLWDLLAGERSAVRAVAETRPYFLHPLRDSRPHWAGLVDDPARFDAEFFGVSPREADYMDPQLRMFLEVAWGAIEDAGCAGAEHNPATGVFVGVMYGDYGMSANHGQAQGTYRCWEGFSLANRLSQLLDFHGPSLAIDTACSSSGTALHLACHALHAGDCQVAVVGGVNLILEPDRFASLGRLGILSSRGVCEPFGADADGTVLGEGCAVVVLRPLRDAVARGDRIYGVVKGTGLSTGSGTVGFTAPNPQAQADAIRRAVEVAHVDPRTISYVETHGTGTTLGDPIEVRGLTLAYGDPGLHDPAMSITPNCRIGSIKPNVGHLEAGAGALGLIKVCLQLSRRTLLPSLTSAKPNPHIPFAQVPFRVQRALEPWDVPVAQVGGRAVAVPRRAGLSSFGVGGANAHVIVEEAPAAQSAVDDPGHDRPAHILALSGRDPEALARQAESRRLGLSRTAGIDFADYAFSVNTGHRHLDWRMAVVAGGREEAVARLDAIASGETPRGVVLGEQIAAAPPVAFLFTGQGSQYAGMGRALYETQPVFKQTLDRCAAVLDALLERPLLDLLFADTGTSDAALLDQTGCTQPALFAFEVALAELWRSWGVHPDVVMGHSAGEIAALCIAGGVSLEDGLALIAARGRLMQALPAGGGMASVMAPEALVLDAIAGREEIAIAAVNAPAQVVISGAGTAVADVTAKLAADGIKSKALTVSHAFHSPLMRPMLAEYERIVRAIRFTPPRIPFISCVEGRLISAEVTTVEYWIRQVLQPVRFADGIRALVAHGAGACVEIGPQPVLLGLGRQCMSDTDPPIDWLPSMRAGMDPWDTLLTSLSTLYVRGVEVDWRSFDAPYRRRRVSVPAYAFKPKSHWLRVAHGIDRPAATAWPRPSDLYVQQWQRAAVPELAADAVGDGSWVVFCDHTAIGEALVGALASRGASVLQVGRGDRFRQVDTSTCVIDPANPQDYVRILSEHAPGTKRQRIIHLWAPEPGRLSSGASAAMLDRAVGTAESVLHVVRALREIGDVRPATLWCVTEGAAVAAAGDLETVVSVLQAPVWGLGQTIGIEASNQWGGLVDLPAQGGEALVETLLAHVLSSDGEERAALRPRERYVARLVHCPEGSRRRPALRSDRTYLVTGGLGALGVRVASWLVDRGARHLVLASRRGAADASAVPAIQALEGQGVHVEVMAADVGTVGDVERMLSHVAASAAPLGGIVHAAGVDTPIRFEDLTAGDIRQAMAAKVAGAWLLHEQTADLPLDLFVMFSSLASVLGAAGRAHYAAANAFLDALAHERRRRHLPVLTVDWGPWAGGGMATEEHLRAFEAIGNYGLDPESALDALDRALSTGEPQVAVASIDWARFAPAYEARRPRPLLEAVRPAMASPSVDVPGPLAGASGAWVSQITRVEASQREEVLRELLRAEVATVLGLESAGQLAVGAGFYDVGMDSLMTAELVGRLNRWLGVPCGGAVVEHTSVAALAPALLERLALPDQSVASAGRAQPHPNVGAWVIELQGLPGSERAARLMELLRQEVGRALGHSSGEPVPAGRQFADMGMDSLTAAELSTQLQRHLGVTVGAALFAHPTVQALTAHLLARLSLDSEPAAATADPARPAPTPTAGIVGYTPARENAIQRFQEEVFPDREPQKILPRFRWMFLESAVRVKRPASVWLYEDAGRVVAHMGAIPVPLKVGQQILPTAWLVDTMVLDDYRGQALGSRLMMEAHESLPFALSLGQSPEMREIQLRLGWKQVAALQTAQLLIRPDRVLKGKLPAPMAWAAGLGMRASSAVRDLLRDQSLGTVREVARFGGAHDALWALMADDVTCAVVRDASYLNWKYVDQPGQRFLRLELVEDGRVRAIAVCMFREPDASYQYRRAFLVDLVVPLSDAALTQRIVRAAAAAAADAGADTLVCLYVSTPLGQALARLGFLRREPERFLLVDPGAVSGGALDQVLDGGGWYVTQGDSDIDRP